MKKTIPTALTGAVLVAMAATTVGGSAVAAPSPKPVPAAPAETLQKDDLPSPLSDKQRELRKEAVANLVKGRTKVETIAGKKVLRVKGAKGKTKDRFVQYDVNRRANIFTILVEFGDQIHPLTGGTAGPLHNQIPQPDRNWDGSVTDDNSTYWIPDFNRAHYLNLMFGATESFKDFYLKQSSGRFLAGGDVSDWVKVPYNEARYGSNKVKGAAGYWPFVRDTAQAWYDAQKAAGKTDVQIKDYLKQFDVWDRYDFDGDGNFDEPDGYIDHFQAIHAGEGEEAGAHPDTIWSHRWYAYGTDAGKTGPAGNLQGGVPIGTTGLWIGDYTTEPENGGLGVFVHEFGHDLGLPDLYDTTNQATNGTGYWSLMSGGSWLNWGKDSIGTSAGFMGPWEKQQLGWLDFTTTTMGMDTSVKLGPAGQDEKTNYQAVAVALPDQTVTNDYNKPFAGAKEYWSGTGSNLDASLTKTIDLTNATSGNVSAMLAYDTEQDYDFYTAEVSTDGGASWTTVGGPVSGSAMTWTPVSYDLSAYVGKVIQFRFHYLSDGGVNGMGVFLDDIKVTVDGTVVSTDGAEGTPEWTLKSFKAMTGTDSYQVPQYYLVENRQYVSYDATLKTGPYNFGFQPDPQRGYEGMPNWVEHFPYQTGMLVWYVNGAYGDNNVSEHPGYGQVLPVDAHPDALMWTTIGKPMSNRIQTYDAPFGQARTTGLNLHLFGLPVSTPSLPGVPTFDDSRTDTYYRTAPGGIMYNSTKTAGSGVKVTSFKQRGLELQVKVDYR